MDRQGRPSLETREELQEVLIREEASQGSGLDVGKGEKGPQECETGRVGVGQQARGFLLQTGVWLTLGRLWNPEVGVTARPGIPVPTRTCQGQRGPRSPSPTKVPPSSHTRDTGLTPPAWPTQLSGLPAVGLQQRVPQDCSISRGQPGLLPSPSYPSPTAALLTPAVGLELALRSQDPWKAQGQP